MRIQTCRHKPQPRPSFRGRGRDEYPLLQTTLQASRGKELTRNANIRHPTLPLLRNRDRDLRLGRRKTGPRRVEPLERLGKRPAATRPRTPRTNPFKTTLTMKMLCVCAATSTPLSPGRCTDGQAGIMDATQGPKRKRAAWECCWRAQRKVFSGSRSWHQAAQLQSMAVWCWMISFTQLTPPRSEACRSNRRQHAYAALQAHS